MQKLTRLKYINQNPSIQLNFLKKTQPIKLNTIQLQALNNQNINEQDNININNNNNNNKYEPYIKIGRFDKPIGTYLVLTPFMFSSALAMSSLQHLPLLSTNIAIFSISAICLRAGGCIVNDFWDRNYDNLVKRTQQRPFATKQLSLPKGFMFLNINFLIGMGGIYLLGQQAIITSLVAIPLTILYPLMKRYTNYPQYFLGLTINQGIFIGWAGMGMAMNWSVLIPLQIGSICWTIIYDTVYAHQDVKYDKQLGLGSTAVSWDQDTIKKLHIHNQIMYFSFLMAGFQAGLHFVSYAFMIAGLHFVIRNKIKNVDLKDVGRCNRFFQFNAKVGFAIFFIICIAKYIHFDIQIQQDLLKQQQALILDNNKSSDNQ